MFEALSQSQLQHYWWIIISLLGALLVFLLFVQGGQSLLDNLAYDEEEKSMLVNSLGRKWELAFTTLVTFGGAMFAAFPLFYSTSFSGAYWLWLIILVCYIIQAISYEYRKKPGNIFGKATYELFLFINGSLGVILLGVAIGSFFNGSEFVVDKYNLSRWDNPLRGIEATFNWHNVMLGFSLFFIARMLGSLYFINNVAYERIYGRSVRMLFKSTIFFTIFFLPFLVRLLFKDGFAYDPATNYIYIEEYKYLKNFVQMPLTLILFLGGAFLIYWGAYITVFKNSRKGIWYVGSGTISAVFSLLIIAGLNNTAFYPAYKSSIFKPDLINSYIQSSLTISKASSSHYTLSVMSYVTLLIPLVLAYIFWSWRKMDKVKINSDEMIKDEHSY